MFRQIAAFIVLSLIIGCSDIQESVCELLNVEITVEECITDSTYNLVLDFDFKNPNNDFFEIFIRDNKSIGYYKLTELPLRIENFKTSGKEFDFIKICINDNPNCCTEHEFITPDCSDKACRIDSLQITTSCLTDKTYDLTIDFTYSNTGNDFFEVFGRKDKPLGYFKLADLPITLENFEASGNQYDFIKVCVNDKPDCCIVHEFEAPDCSEKKCNLSDIKVEPGNCISENLYNLTIDFNHSNTGNDFFEVFGRKDKPLGYFKLADLPITLENFEASGNQYDFIKVCVNDKPDCCIVHEFEAPDCSEKKCSLSDLKVEPGNCISENLYNLTIDFKHSNTGNDFFEVFGRKDKPLGYFKLADLPITLENFEASGNQYDFIKVCVNDKPDCCIVHEFEAPDCSEKKCEIWDLELAAGSCETDSTYNLSINFKQINAGNDFFEVFTRNNKYIGSYKLEDLPITIKDFKKSGHEYDYIKICVNDNSNCCKESEIKSPKCN